MNHVQRLLREHARPLAALVLIAALYGMTRLPTLSQEERSELAGRFRFTNHVRWQGRCRELFLREHAPEVLAELTQGLALATTRVSCDYLAELSAFDEIVIRMWLRELRQNRITMRFEYWRRTNGAEELVARGEQEVACMRRDGEQIHPTAIPEALRNALQPYADPG